MRRIALIFSLLLAAGVTVAATAGADDKKSYQAELFNAFGLVKGSELRVAGVKAGTVTDLDITEEKTALISFDVDPEFPELKADASCSSEPQSLIAEYFLDCQPGTSEQPLEGPIPAARNQITVQNDLVANTLREPFKRRFQLILNEFGTALVGNGEKLNAAIRAGAPALRELREVLDILGRQNTLIAELNANSDVIFQQLTDRREDVVRFIDEAEDTARVSAERREALARDFDLLDDFLAELRPTVVELGNLAREQTPLLTDLRAAAPGLNVLGKNLPRFNEGTRVSLESLGRASLVGRRALSKAEEEIAALNRASERSFPASDILAEFLENLDDPRAAVEEDRDARDDLREQPGEANRRVALLEQKLGVNLEHPGYTGLEGLLNYGYIQTLSLNLFSTIGHGLHLNLVGVSSESEGGGECGHVSGHPDYPAKGTDGSVRTRNVKDAPFCAAQLGDYQPGITPGTVDESTGLALGLSPYDNSVCPDGSTREAICNPAVDLFAARSGNRAQGGPGPPEAQEILKTIQEGQKEGKVNKKKLRELLDLPVGAPLPPEISQIVSGVTQGIAPSDQSTATGLLNFLFGP